MNPDQFDSELKTYFRSIKGEIKNEHNEYIKKHPELRQILNDFLSSVMLEKPADVYEYAREFFSYFNIEKDKVTQKPIVISGPSGSGKHTIMRSLVQKYSNLFEICLSYTTRQPRQGELHGQDYFFVSRGEFEKEIAKDNFLEFSQVRGEYFGVHKGKLNATIITGKIVLIETDVEGAEQIYKKDPSYKFIFLNTPSDKLLAQRLKDRKTYTQDEINQRLKDGEKEVHKHKKLGYYYDIINDDLQNTIEDFISYTKANYKKLTIEPDKK